MGVRFIWARNKGLGRDGTETAFWWGKELLVEKKGTGIFSRSIMLSSRCLITLSSSNNWWVRSFCDDKWLQGDPTCCFICLISADILWINVVCCCTTCWRASIFRLSLDSKSMENHSSSGLAILMIIRKDIFRCYTADLEYTPKTRAEGSMYPTTSLPLADHLGCQ